MDPRFVTSLTTDSLALPNLDAWEPWRGEGRRVWKELKAAGREDDASLIDDYGAPLGPRARPLNPVACHPLSSSVMLARLGISSRLIYQGQFGLPPLFACSLTYEAEGERFALCESLPFTSVEEAGAFFSGCIASADVRLIAESQGGAAAAYAFALCAIPGSAKKLVSQPNPTRPEVAKLADELSEAVSTLARVIGKWDGTDAYRYLVGPQGRVSKSFLFSHLVTKDLRRIPSELSQAKQSLGEHTKRAGRHTQGGRNHLVALLLRALWLRVGMTGQVSTSPSSRFMKACNLLLPMYGIPKADYSQFMKAELSKKRLKGVVIGA